MKLLLFVALTCILESMQMKTESRFSLPVQSFLSSFFCFFFVFLVVAAELFNIIWSNFVCSDICMYDDDVIYLQSSDIWRQELYGIFDKCKE